MPPEPPKSKLLRRRPSRKDLDDLRFDGTHARVLEEKRTRGEVSCAECRRLKIKCDKQVPCQSCIRRGCVSLCPNGSLATGQGTRFVLAATEHLHKRIAKLTGRVRQLEDALSALQAKHSTEPHPLLHEDLIAVDEKEPDEMTDIETTTVPGAPSGDVIDAFGTLSISEHGVSRFFGRTAGTETLLMAGSDVSSLDSPDSARTPDSNRDSKSPMSVGTLSLFSNSFPFTPVGQPPQVQEMIEADHLPAYDKALAYCETYFQQVSWLFRGVTRGQVLDDMLPVIYKHQPAPPGESYSSPHDLALLFCIFSIASLVGDQPSAQYSDHYYQIARAALSLQPVLEKPSMVTIQVLHLLSMYNAMSGSADMGNESSMETTWSLITLASHLSQTIGLHRDSARWGLSPKMVQRRRILFWDLFVADVWQSMNTGRPPAFSLPYIDCGFPHYDDAGQNPETAFELWQCRFAAEVVAEVAARTLTAEAPSYATIMELDRKVREYPIPESMSDSHSESFSSAFQRCVLDHVRETVLLYIHRSFFAQAIIDHPENPLKSAYGPSFTTACKASSTILKSVQEQFTQWPQSSAAFWTMWTFAFSAAIVFGTVVTRGPRSPLAKEAMRELEQACILFSKASVHSSRATRALPILKKLSEKARYALNAAQSDPSGDHGLHWANIKQEAETDDELAIFAGRIRFVNKRNNELVTPEYLGGGTALPESSHNNHSPSSISHPTDSTTAIPQIRQPQPVSSYRLETIPPDANMDTSTEVEVGWSGQTEQYAPQGVPRTAESGAVLHYGYPPDNGSAIAGSDTTSVSSMSSYSWMDATGNGGGPGPSAARYEPRISRMPASRTSQGPSGATSHQQHGYYDPGPSPLRSLSYFAAQAQPQYGHSQSMYDVHHPQPHSSHPHPSPLTTTSTAGHSPSGGHDHSSYHHSGRGHQQPPTPTSSSTGTFSPHPSYPVYSPFHHPHQGPPAPPANPALADLGIASRDSRLDEKWSLFMSESGILEGMEFRPGPGQ